MPRTANTTDALLADLQKRLVKLVQTARKEGRAEALADVREMVSGGTGRAPARRAARKGSRRAAAKKPARRSSRKSRKPRKNPWAGYSPEEKLARINKMRKGRGLPPKKSL